MTQLLEWLQKSGFVVRFTPANLRMPAMVGISRGGSCEAWYWFRYSNKEGKLLYFYRYLDGTTENATDSTKAAHTADFFNLEF